MTNKDFKRLVKIHEKMLDLLEEARRFLEREGGIEWERANSYWLAHIEMALTKENRYLGSSMYTMEDTLRALKPCGNDDDDWSEEYDDDDWSNYDDDEDDDEDE
jgi:hypothetical protein